MFKELQEFANEPSFSIAIFLAKTLYNNNHTGIIVKSGSEIKVYHYAWHLKLELVLWPTFLQDVENFRIKRWVKFNSLTADPGVAEFRIPPLIKFLELIYVKNKDQIPYSLNFSHTKFTEEGDLLFGPEEFGLTCSTFVACFFRSSGLDLVNLETWEAREFEDPMWKEWIVMFMRKSNVPETHLANVLSEVLNYRLKPEEIAVSSSKEMDDLPADFEFCSKAGALFNLL